MERLFRCSVSLIYAPSATVTTVSIALSQQDFDRREKEGKLEKNTQYSIVKR